MSAAATLDILVENSGRVNFTSVIRGERKGITGSVTIDGHAPQHWQIYSLPMTDLARLRFNSGRCEGPCFYRFTVTTPGSGPLPDTFIETHSLSKGVAFLNGRPLGRFWSVGPQFSLYTPGPWLKPGQNEVIVFDLQGKSGEALTTIDHHDYGASASH